MEDNNIQPVDEGKQDLKQDPSDNLTPEHPRFKEVIAEKNELRKTVDDLKTELESLKERVGTRQEEDEYTDEQLAALEKIERGLKARGYMTKEEFKQELKAEKMARQLTSLEKRYNGQNGLPKFDPGDVTAYAKKYGFSDLEKAYRDMHFDAIVDQRAKRGTVEVPTSEKPGAGERQIGQNKLTRDDIANMSDEEYEKNREAILASLKPQS